MSWGRGLVLALHVPGIPGKISAVDCLLAFEISRQGELLGPVGLKQAGEGYWTAKTRDYGAE